MSHFKAMMEYWQWKQTLLDICFVCTLVTIGSVWLAYR